MNGSNSVKDTPLKTSADRKQISLDHQREVDAWCKALSCTEGELRMALQMVGTSTEKVRAFIREAHARTCRC